LLLQELKKKQDSLGPDEYERLVATQVETSINIKFNYNQKRDFHSSSWLKSFYYKNIRFYNTTSYRLQETVVENSNTVNLTKNSTLLKKKNSITLYSHIFIGF
jgi:hypothetical protein